MRFKYEDLEVWQIALQLIKAGYKIMDKLPQSEQFGLISQGKRALVSVALNIAEGSGRHTDKDFSTFINRSITSLQEVDAVLKISMMLEYINKSDYGAIESLIDKEYFKLIAFDKALKKEPVKRKRYNND